MLAVRTGPVLRRQFGARLATLNFDDVLPRQLPRRRPSACRASPLHNHQACSERRATRNPESIYAREKEWRDNKGRQGRGQQDGRQETVTGRQHEGMAVKPDPSAAYSEPEPFCPQSTASYFEEAFCHAASAY